jgi:hypothetical protein
MPGLSFVPKVAFKTFEQRGGNAEEKEVIKTSLNHIEEEMESGDRTEPKGSSNFSSFSQQPRRCARQENHSRIQRGNRYSLPEIHAK